jgi:hypothetical protein
MNNESTYLLIYSITESTNEQCMYYVLCIMVKGGEE